MPTEAHRAKLESEIASHPQAGYVIQVLHRMRCCGPELDPLDQKLFQNAITLVVQCTIASRREVILLGKCPQWDRSMFGW
jgi:hypothetical protein